MSVLLGRNGQNSSQDKVDIVPDLVAFVYQEWNVVREA